MIKSIFTAALDEGAIKAAVSKVKEKLTPNK
jgi:hypothetical protein